eukprot:3615067-Rhodomonas_salina.2
MSVPNIAYHAHRAIAESLQECSVIHDFSTGPLVSPHSTSVRASLYQHTPTHSTAFLTAPYYTISSTRLPTSSRVIPHAPRRIGPHPGTHRSQIAKKTPRSVLFLFTTTSGPSANPKNCRSFAFGWYPSLHVQLAGDTGKSPVCPPAKVSGGGYEIKCKKSRLWHRLTSVESSGKGQLKHDDCADAFCGSSSSI